MSHRCPITYEIIPEDKKYSEQGLKLLAPTLTSLADLLLSAKELRQEARQRSIKMSIQGVQPKLSAVLNIKEGRFDIVNHLGKYILKPPLEEYAELPPNEDLTMKLASLVGIEVPLHGMVYNNDQTLTYFIKRFDRTGHKDRVLVEDFAQLSGNSRDTKYDFSMEKIIAIIDLCTFPMLEKNKLLLRVLFNYLIGNEDMHLKNFSLITRNNKTELAPAYDFLNTTIAIGQAKEQLALPINGKKNNLTRRDLIDYYAKKCLNLNDRVIQETLDTLKAALPTMSALINISFLSPEMRAKYKDVVQQRARVLFG